MAGACVVISKLERSPYRRAHLRRLAGLNERTPGLPKRAFRELAELAPLENGRPAVVGPSGPVAGDGHNSTVRTLGFRKTDTRRWPPLVHPKLALLGHLWWHDEDPLGGVVDDVGFTRYRL